MPALRFDSATSTDALAARKFNTIPSPGAIINLWASGATAADNFGFSVGQSEVCVQGTEANIEVAVDVVDVQRDQILFDEVVGPGQMFLPVTATAEMQFLIHIRYL